VTPRQTHWTLSVFALLAAVFILAPFLVVLYISFTPYEYLKPPRLSELSVAWYRELLNRPKFVEGFFRSVLVGLASSVVSLVIGSLAGYALARGRLPFRELLATALLFPLMIPGVVLGLFLLVMFTELGISGTFTRLVASHVVITMPYAVRMMHAAFEVFDPAMILVARNLGAGPWTIIRRIVLPLIRPALLATASFTFIVSFDNLTVSLFLVTPEFVTLPVAIYSYITEVTDPAVAAVSTLLIAFAYLLFFTLERLWGIGRIFQGGPT
jgi:putative spermidine/putrescine transport system permease protein